jgi:hypothetical protein
VLVGAVLSNQTVLFLPRDWAVRFKLLDPLLVPTLMGEGAILMLFISWGLLNTSTLAGALLKENNGAASALGGGGDRRGRPRRAYSTQGNTCTTKIVCMEGGAPKPTMSAGRQILRCDLPGWGAWGEKSLPLSANKRAAQLIEHRVHGGMEVNSYTIN